MPKLTPEKAAQRLAEIWEEIGDLQEKIDFKKCEFADEANDLLDKIQVNLDTLVCRLRGDKS